MDQNDRYHLRQVLKKEELLTMAARIKGNFPYCQQMYNTLLLNARGFSDFFQYEFYVPKYHPNSHIIIWRTLVERKGMSIYCTEEEVPLLIKVLKGRDFLSIVKEAPVDIGILADYLAGPVLDSLQELLQMRLLDQPDNAYAYVTQQSHLLRCPAGMKVQRLGRAGVQRMLQVNDYWKKTPLDLTCRLAENLPALGVYLDPEVMDEQVIDTNDLSSAEPEATPIAWVCTNSYGSVSMLRTEDKYRRKGLASLLIQVLARLLLVEGYFPNAIVLARNDASAAVFNKLIGWKKTHCAHWIVPAVTR